MRNKYFFAVTMSLLLSLLSVKAFAQNAIDIVVEGENLNIGTGNVLEEVSHGISYKGNAVGFQNILHSAHALAIGMNDTIGSNSSGALTAGISNYVQGNATMGLGHFVKVNGEDNIGIGHYIRVNGNSGCMVIGSGLEGYHGDAAYLVNDSSNSLMIGFNSVKPTLFVSESPNNYSQNILNKTGRVAIGDVMPQAKLHIRSDVGENAGIILTPGNLSSDSAFIQFKDAQHSITVDEHGQMNITIGNNNVLGVQSQNFNLNGSLVAIGAQGFTLSKNSTSSFGLNAYPSNGYYQRGNSSSSSYVMEFSDAAFKLRTAPFRDPRNDIINNWTDAMVVTVNGAITLNGKVGVNTENTYSGYALAVDGGVITTKVHIQDVSDWQDRVFSEDYPLMPLDEVGAYVAENKHLPGIPSEAEVKANGYDVATMQAALLGKIEELTLHMLRQQREIDSLRTLVTVSFGYDACGNRTSRTLEFSRGDGDKGGKPGDKPNERSPLWQASVNDSFLGGEVLLFPNPTEGGFYLSLTGTETPQNAKAMLCTPDGKVLEERAVTGTSEEFDLADRPAGIYLLRLSSEGEAKVWKVIKRN